MIGGNLTAQSTGTHRGFKRGIQIPETQLQALLPFLPRRQSAPSACSPDIALSSAVTNLPNRTSNFHDYQRPKIKFHDFSGFP